MTTKNLCVLVLVLFSLACYAAENSTEPQKPTGKNAKAAAEPAEEAAEPANTLSEAPYTLEQCIGVALRNNPDVIAGGFDILTAGEEKNIAASKKWFTVGIEGRYHHFLDDQRLIQPRYNGELGVFGDDIVSGNVVLRMPIYTSGRIENEIKATELLQISSSHDLTRTRRELIFNVSEVFYNILAQEQIVKSLVFSKETLEQHKKRIEDMIEVQKATNVDLLRTQVRLADIEQQIISQKNIASILRKVLVNYMGIDNADAEINVSGSLELTDIKSDPSVDIPKAYTQRADYLSSRERLQAEQERLKIARAGRSPIISAEAWYGVRSAIDPSVRPRGTDETDDVGFIGVVLEWPLFEGGAIDARVSREQFKLRSQRQHLRKLELQISLEIKTALSNIASSKERVLATEESIKQAKESLRIEQEKYGLGKGSITDVLDAQAAMLDAQTAYYHALSDYNSSVAQWHLAIGDEK